MSLPARGAWIEIIVSIWCVYSIFVAPREGSVDRNYNYSTDASGKTGRSPRGERG